MSIVYTADVFCDGQSCSQWISGLTGIKPPSYAATRKAAMPIARWVRVDGKDYCPQCAYKRFTRMVDEIGCKDCKGDTPCEKHQIEIDTCCDNELRNINGDCDNCGDPCL